jgi:hypothetical protein
MRKSLVERSHLGTMTETFGKGFSATAVSHVLSLLTNLVRKLSRYSLTSCLAIR